MKKIVSLLMIFIVGVLLFACGDKEKTTTTTTTTSTTTTESTTTSTTTTEEGDKIPPAFVGAVFGELTPVEHLKGDEIDLLEGVSARDNISDFVEVTISDLGGYDKDVPGVYTITIQAEDGDGNTSSVTKKVTVLEIITRILDAVVIGDEYTEYVYNDTEALTYTTSGTKFRTSDLVQVMTKQFFIDEYNAHKSEHTNNNLIPYFPNGVIVVVDNNFNIKLVRVGNTTPIEISGDGVVTTENLTWSNVIDATNGGGNFKGIVDAVESAIPDGGYLLFSGNWGDQVGRMFLMKHFFNSEYTGGVVTPEQFDAEYSSITINLEEDFTEVIALPDNIPAPELTVERHVLKWEAVNNALSYEVYVDGELKDTVTGTSLALADLNLNVTDPATSYEITVKAISKDIYQWSSSLMSEPVMYEAINLQLLTAPVISVDGNNLTWDLVTGAASYNIYISITGITSGLELLENTNNNTYDLTNLLNTYNGNVKLYVKAVGDNEHYDSDNSNEIVYFVGDLKTIVYGNDKFDLLLTTVNDYFNRRNTDYKIDKTGYANYPAIFLITDIYNINSAPDTLAIKEAFSVIVLLDENGAPKLIRSILKSQSWTKETGWINNDDKYTDNADQLVFLKDIVSENDQLLIFKNTSNIIEYYQDGVITLVNPRNIGGNLYVKDWVTPNGESWRDGVDTFKDPSNVTFTIEDKIDAIRLEKPEIIFDEQTGIISWSSINNATGYYVIVNDLAPILTTDLEYDITSIISDWNTLGFTVKVITAGDGTNYLSSLLNSYEYVIKTPVSAPSVNLDNNTLSWNAIDNATSYDVYVSFGSEEIKIGNVTDTTFDISNLNNLYAGYTNFHVIAIGGGLYLDSPSSNVVQKFFGQIEALTIGDYTVDVLRTSSYNYFARRNTAYGTDNTGFATAPYLFLITDINSIKNDIGVTVTEAYSTIVLLDSSYNAKYIRNIMPGQAWRLGEGWISDDNYSSNGAQLANITGEIVDGDMLLIGKNSNPLVATKSDQSTINVIAREFIAYYYVNTWAGFPAGATGTDGWRAPITSFIDPTTVTFTIKLRLETPEVIFDNGTGKISWSTVANATGYNVIINDLAPVLVTDLEYDILSIISDYETVGFTAKVYAVGDGTNYIDSYPGIFEFGTIVTPTVSLNNNILSWDVVDGAASYDIYVSFAGQNIKVNNITETIFDITTLNALYSGNTNLYVIAIGDDTHLDSLPSNEVQAFIGEIESLTIGDYTVDVLKTTAFNYFTRRNTVYGTDNTGFATAPYLFLITDINNIKNDIGVPVTEAYSTIAVLDSSYNAKYIRNIMPGQAWRLGEGWISDDNYSSNGAQLANITGEIVDGDMLLIGKNSNMLTATKSDQSTIVVDAREFIAYHYVNTWADFPTACSSGGWRDPITSFMDPTNVTFTLAQ